MYTILILAEQAMTPGDAAEVVSLHEGIDDARLYHVLIPSDNAQVRVEAALGSLGAGDTLGAPGPLLEDYDTEVVQSQLDADAASAVALSVSALHATGHSASGEFSAEDPVGKLEALVTAKSADEVIVMSRPHLVQEFLHLDWTSRARRRLGVPVLHLVEHESLDAEASSGQGITGM